MSHLLPSMGLVNLYWMDQSSLHISHHQVGRLIRQYLGKTTLYSSVSEGNSWIPYLVSRSFWKDRVDDRCIRKQHRLSIIPLQYKHLLRLRNRQSTQNQDRYLYRGELSELWLGHVSVRYWACIEHVSTGSRGRGDFDVEPDDGNIVNNSTKNWIQTIVFYTYWNFDPDHHNCTFRMAGGTSVRKLWKSFSRYFRKDMPRTWVSTVQSIWLSQTWSQSKHESHLW